MTAHNRTILALLPMIACIVPVQAQNLPVYANSLAPGWQNWSWSTTAGFANGDPAYGGSGASISVRHDAAWAGFYLHNNSTISTNSYVSLRFQIHGGTAGSHHLRVIAYDGSGAEGTGVSLVPTVAGQWNLVEIQLSAFNVGGISGLVWQDTSGGPQPVYYLDEIEFVAGSTPPGQGPDVSVDVAADRHPISPQIYGMNFADAGLAAELSLPINRWGGNSTTRYNWQLDASNRASDWYFENLPNDNNNPGQLPNGSDSDEFIDANEQTGAESLITIPMIGWTPKSRAVACGYSVAKYGAQQSVDPWQPDCGNGVRTDGTPITNNDPLDTSFAIDPSFVQQWIAHLIARYGTAANGGVKFYNLDNETALWNSTHRDVHPLPVSYDELRDRTYSYAAAIKAADPSARTLGPVAWGWVEYFYSALDVAAGGSWWETRPDRMAHGDVPFIEWYLQQMRAYEQQHGVRILDYMDLHYYPQSGEALSPAGDAAMQALRLRSTRSLWDPSYVDESWIGDTVRLLPRMREWAAADYPGTKLAITEYNWGGVEHINGALAEAEILGIFGRERLDLATMWDPPQPTQPAAYAFRIYRNYDGAGSKFGETSVRGQSADPNKVSIFAAQRSDGATTLVLINKTGNSLISNLTLTNASPAGPAKAYRYSAANLAQIVPLADIPIPGAPVSLVLPASSITLLVIPNSPLGDLNGDGIVSVLDIPAFVNVLLGIDSDSAHIVRSDLNTDGRADGDDVAAFVAALLD